MDFWLPEFEPSPEVSAEELFPYPVKSKKRDRWQKKSMAVLLESPQHEFRLNVREIRSIAPDIIPRCKCPVCHLVSNTLYVGNNTQTLQSSKHMQQLMQNLELVAHGRERFTLYDRTMPWQRLHINNCTNPRPLDRRMPPVDTGRSEVVNNVYYMKMLPPGKVIQDPKKRSIN